MKREGLFTFNVFYKTARFFSTVSILFMKTDRMGLQPILSAFQSIAIDTMLMNTMPLNGAALNWLKDVKCEQTFNWDQFKDPISYLCLAGALVVSWSLGKTL